ncbi:MAG TPA: hypothetical protein VF145_00025 [Chitinophagaceae bacterium]
MCIQQEASAQKLVQESFFYNPKGLTFIPGLKKPSIIYQGRLFVGRKQLAGLFSHLHNEQLNFHFGKYKANKTAAAVLSIAGAALSVYSFIDWRSNDRDFNWYTFGGGILLSGASGYLDAKGNEHLRKAALIFDEATRNTTFVPRQTTIRYIIPI